MLFIGDTEGEGNSEDQTPPRSESTSEPVIEGRGEELESRKVVMGTSGRASGVDSTSEERANKRIVFMKEFIVDDA